ncbi:MAG: methionine biosynthesis protein MetW [Candidatus Magasanikbacteria bacterium]|nr:methionine biosynthesis protein MetW [Candidatus Magasanikbacteria bacterium]
MSLIKLVKKISGDFKQIFGYPKCDYGTDYTVDYQKYWLQRRGLGPVSLSPWQTQRAAWALSLFETGSSILDVGWKDGDVVGFLCEQGGYKRIDASIDENVLLLAKSLGISNVGINFSDLEAIDKLGMADYILGFDILEHVGNSETVLFHLLKKANKGLLVSFPNSGYFAHRLRLLFGRFPLQWRTHPGEHLRFWTVRDMRFWLNSLGLKKQARIILYEGIPILNKVFPKLFAQGILIFIKK